MVWTFHTQLHCRLAIFAILFPIDFDEIRPNQRLLVNLCDRRRFVSHNLPSMVTNWFEIERQSFSSSLSDRPVCGPWDWTLNGPSSLRPAFSPSNRDLIVVRLCSSLSFSHVTHFNFVLVCAFCQRDSADIIDYLPKFEIDRHFWTLNSV